MVIRIDRRGFGEMGEIVMTKKLSLFLFLYLMSSGALATEGLGWGHIKGMG
jgi:hypothetical protein